MVNNKKRVHDVFVAIGRLSSWKVTTVSRQKFCRVGHSMLHSYYLCELINKAYNWNGCVVSISTNIIFYRMVNSRAATKKLFGGCTSLRKYDCNYKMYTKCARVSASEVLINVTFSLTVSTDTWQSKIEEYYLRTCYYKRRRVWQVSYYKSVTKACDTWHVCKIDCLNRIQRGIKCLNGVIRLTIYPMTYDLLIVVKACEKGVM